MLYSPITLDRLTNPKHHQILRDYEVYLDSHRAQSTVKIRVWYAYQICLWAEQLDADAGTLDVWGLSFNQLARWLSRRGGTSASTKYSARASARVFYAWAETSGLITVNIATRLPQVRRPRGVPHACPQQVLETGLRNATRKRDILMLLFGSYAGLRAREIAPLHTRDVIGGTQIRVTGKGGHERMVPLHPAIQEYLPYFNDGFFFPSELSSTGHVLAASIGQRVRDLLDETGWNCHSLRHRFATEVYHQHPDLLALRDLLGHTTVATTQIYASADATRLNEYVAALPRVGRLKHQAEHQPTFDVEYPPHRELPIPAVY